MADSVIKAANTLNCSKQLFHAKSKVRYLAGFFVITYMYSYSFKKQRSETQTNHQW